MYESINIYKINVLHMKKHLSILTLSTLLVASLLLSGCAMFGGEESDNGRSNKKVEKIDKDPEEVIKDMQSAMGDVEVVSLDMNLGVDFDMESSGKGTLALNFAGYSNESDMDDIEMDMTLGGSFDFNIVDSYMETEQEVKGSAEMMMKIVDSMLYFNVSDVELQGEDMEEFNSMVEAYLDTWYSMPFESPGEDMEYGSLSEAFIEGFNQGLVENQDLSEEEIEAVEQLVEDTVWFSVETERGTEEISGVETYVLDVALNKEGILEFFEEFATILEEEIDEDDMDELRQVMDIITMEATMYIGVDDSYLYKMDGMFEMEVTEETLENNPEFSETGMVSIDLELNMKDFGEKKEVDAPAASETFDLMEMMMGPSMDMDYDYDMYEDMDYDAMEDMEDWEEFDMEDWEEFDLEDEDFMMEEDF